MATKGEHFSEYDLFLASIIGDLEARERVVFGLKNLIWTVKNRYHSKLEDEEALQEGIIGILEAIATFDPDKGSMEVHAFTNIHRRLSRLKMNQERLPGVRLEAQVLRISDQIIEPTEESRWIPETSDRTCARCQETITSDGRPIKGLCARCERQRVRMQAMHGGHGVCARCGLVLGSRMRAPWCPGCGFNAELRECCND